MAGRKAGKGGRKRHQKLHAMTGNDLLAIDDVLVAAGTAGDSSIGKKLVRLLAWNGGDMCLDSPGLNSRASTGGVAEDAAPYADLDKAASDRRYKPHIARAYAVRAELAERKKPHRELMQARIAGIFMVEPRSLRTWTARYLAEGAEGLRGAAARGASRPCPTRKCARQSKRPESGGVHSTPEEEADRCGACRETVGSKKAK